MRNAAALHLLGGTGTYKRTIGLLQTSGRVNLTTLEGSIAYEGKICPAGEDEDEARVDVAYDADTNRWDGD